MKLTSIIDEIHLRERYKNLCMEFCEEKYGGSRPKKEEVLLIFSKVGFKATYKVNEKFYLVSNKIGKFNLDFHFEFDGATCDIYLYIKCGEYWPLHNKLSFLYPVGYIIEEEVNYTPIGKNIFFTTLEQLEIILGKCKIFLNDFLLKTQYWV